MHSSQAPLAAKIFGRLEECNAFEFAQNQIDDMLNWQLTQFEGGGMADIFPVNMDLITGVLSLCVSIRSSKRPLRACLIVLFMYADLGQAQAALAQQPQNISSADGRPLP